MVNNPSITPSASPLSIKDIWQKLATLYDLDGLDELEDSSNFMAEEERLSEDSSSVPYFGSLGGKLGDGSYLQDFYLPWDDFSNLVIEHAISKDSESSEEDVNQQSENGNASSEEIQKTLSKKRRRSQSSESQPHISEISEVENEESEPGKKQVPVNRTKRSRTKRQTIAQIPPRSTRNTRQRAAAVAAAAAVANTSGVKSKTTAISETAHAEEDEETGTERSEREGSAPLEISAVPTKTTGRVKRTRNTKVSPKIKTPAVPIRRSTRRK